MWLRHRIAPRHAKQQRQQQQRWDTPLLLRPAAAPWPSQLLLLHHHHHQHHHSLVSAAAALADAPAADDAHAPPPLRLRRSHVRRCRTVFTLCDALALEGDRLPPRTWVTALVHLVDLLESHGQHMTPGSWRQLRTALHGLLGLQQLQQQKGRPPAAADGGAAAAVLRRQPHHHQQQQQQQHEPPPPIAGFSGHDVATLLWAAAKLQLTMGPSAWQLLMAQAQAVAPSMTPRETALSAWALSRLQAQAGSGPPPQAWLRLLLQRQQQAEAEAAAAAAADAGGNTVSLGPAAYSGRSLTMLLHSCVRLNEQLPPAWHPQLLERLHELAAAANSSSSSSHSNNNGNNNDSSSAHDVLQGRDIALLVWSLGGLTAHRPPPDVLDALLSASRRHLSYLSCAELTALLAGLGRLRALPPGPLLLEVWDQLYWTADQLEWGQAARVVWALGRLRCVALPAELQERLLAFAALQLKQQIVALEAGAGDAQQQARQRLGLACTVTQMLCGLAGLREQLVEPQPFASQHASLLLLVLDAAEPNHQPHAEQAAAAGRHRQEQQQQQAQPARLTPAHVAAALHAAGRLGARLPPGSSCERVQALLLRLQGRFTLAEAAAAAWGAVRVGCRPGREWVHAWLAATTDILHTAGAPVLHMLLAVACESGHAPPAAWWRAAAARLQALVPRMNATNCLGLARLLQAVSGLQQQQLAAHSSAAGDGGVLVRRLLAAVAARVEALEVAGQAPADVVRAVEALQLQLVTDGS